MPTLQPRSIAAIQAQINLAIQANTNLYNPSAVDPAKRGLTSTSLVAIWSLMTFIVAVTINLFEQILYSWTVVMEAAITQTAAGSDTWIVAFVKRFQYSTSSNQIAQWIGSEYKYPIINTALQIINQVAVVTNAPGARTVKISSNNTPVSPAALSALQSYFENGAPAGIYTTWINANADFILIEAKITYDGQYAATIQSDVITALNNFLSNFDTNNFNGIIEVSQIQNCIFTVAGVKDVVLTKVEARAATVAAVYATQLIESSQIIISTYNPFSGYLIADTDSGRTFTDTLIFNVG